MIAGHFRVLNGGAKFADTQFGFFIAEAGTRGLEKQGLCANGLIADPKGIKLVPRQASYVGRQLLHEVLDLAPEKSDTPNLRMLILG
jgi:hypothetical protein